MSADFVWLYLIFGILLRLGIPIGITLALGWGLRRLDEKWRAEASQDDHAVITMPKYLTIAKCWDVKSCSPKMRENCQAYLHPNIPCWEFRRSNGSVNKVCQSCEYFKETFALANLQ